MASNLNLTIDQGADFQRVLTIKDSNGDAIDLTGYTFRGQARTAYGAAAIGFSFVFVIRNQTTNKGEVDWTLPNSTFSSTTLTKVTTYVYDVEMVSAGGIVTRLVEGSVAITPEVTK
jgi:hypothetical protein